MELAFPEGLCGPNRGKSMSRILVRSAGAVAVIASLLAGGCSIGKAHESSSSPRSSSRSVTVRAPAIKAGAYRIKGAVSIGGGVQVRFLTRQPAGAQLRIVTAGAVAPPAGRIPLARPARFELIHGTFGRGAVLTYPLPATMASPDPSGTIEIGTRQDSSTQ